MDISCYRLGHVFPRTARRSTFTYLRPSTIRNTSTEVISPLHGQIFRHGRWTIMRYMAMTSPVSRFLAPVGQAQRASYVSTDQHLDRLPTVTASAALEELKQDQTIHISTGLDELDKHLQDASSSASQVSGGVKRGQVTEIWGPPGTGKTALG